MPDWLDKVIIAALGLLSSGGGITWWVTYRKDKRDERADDRASQAGKVDLVTQMMDDLTKAQSRITELFGKVEDALSDAAASRRAAEAADQRSQAVEGELSRVRATLAYIATHVAPILEWIDAGAQPPVPVIPEDLRRLIDTDDAASVTRDHR